MKRRFWIGLLGGLVATGVWWFRAQDKPAAPVGVVAVARPFVQIAGAGTGATDRLMREKADFFDPTPLFFPTEWNYGQMPLRADLRQGLGQVFVSFPPLFTATEENIQNYAATTTAAPESLAEVLSSGNQTPFAGMGQVDDPRPPLAERGAFLAIRRFGDKDNAIAQVLSDLPWRAMDYEPLEYMITVSPAGLVGDLVIVKGSGAEEVDVFFRDYLVKTYRVGERLAPGSYQVWIGP